MKCRSKAKPYRQVSKMRTGLLGSSKITPPLNSIQRKTISTNERQMTENAHLIHRIINFKVGSMPIPMKIMVKPVFKWR